MVKAKYMIFLLVSVFLWGANSTLAAPIRYKQTMTNIFQEDQFTGWPSGYESYGRWFGAVTNSSDGSRIAFTVVCPVGNDYYVHTYAADSEGSGLVDLTSGLPGTVAPHTVSFLQLDRTGSRLFFRAPNVGIYTNVFYFDLATQNCAYAVTPEAGEDYALVNFDFRKPYSLTTLGDQIYLYFKHNAGYDPVAERNNRGIYTASLGGLASKVMDMDQLPGEQNLNLLSFLGSAAGGSRNILAWNEDYFHPPATGMYRAEGPTRVPDELHTYVWPEQDLYQHLISADGTRALYQYMDDGPRSLYAVGLDTGTKIFLNQTGDLNGYFAPTMSPSGKYAFFSTTGHRRTRFHVATGDQRDTFTYHFAESRCTSSYAVSDITEDDRYYYMGSKCDGGVARIHRIDMAPLDFSQAPNITGIEFTPSRLLGDGIAGVTVEAAVSDAQGPGTVSWVRMQSLVDGLEKPEWLAYEPITYDWTLYDDGTHGDRLAGDGMYTNDTIRARPTSNFYQRFSLPKSLGIRIITRDQDYNYVMADTVLTVADTLTADSSSIMHLLLLGD